jgi:guanylate kinase
MQVREHMPEAVLVFLEPPSWEDLESRLTGRGTESDEQVLARLSMAKQELEAASEFDHVIVNADVAQAAHELVSYLS